MKVAEIHDTRLDRYRTPALVAAAAGLLLCVAGAFLDRQQFFRSYLIGFVFIAMLSLGALAVLMLQYLTGGMWGVVLRRSLESSTRLLPLVALAFVPIAFGLEDLYPWAGPEAAHDPLLQKKAAYLNEPAFVMRSIVFFAIWSLAAYLLNRWSRRQEERETLQRGLKLRHVSAAGLLLMALTLTFASIDWMMSLEPHWFSTMYGISFIVGTALTAFAFAIIVAVVLSSQEPLADVIEPNTFRDLGNLMFAFIMLWAYTAFSQFLLIWYGNIREEVPYYLTRARGGWGVVAGILILFHFFAPFFLLLMRRIKDRGRTLGKVALLVLAMRVVDLAWLIIPAFSAHGGHAAFHLHWLDFAAVGGLFALWFFFFVSQLKRRPLLPMHEIREGAVHG